MSTALAKNWLTAYRSIVFAIIGLGVFPNHAFGQVADQQRQEAVGQVIAGLESYAADNGSFTVAGSGHSGAGQGWLHYQGGSYPSSIYTGISQYLSDVPADPLHTDLSRYSSNDFLIYRCQDRVGVFAKADSLQPSDADQTWWTQNSCTNYPVSRLNHQYFQVSQPVSDVYDFLSLDAPRQEAVGQVIAGLEAYAADNGSFTVAGSGYKGAGLGWFHYQGGSYPSSIYTGISQYLPDVPADPLHIDLSSYSSNDFLIYRCQDRVGVFAKADSLQPSDADQTWWTQNSCTNYPVSRLNHQYFQVSQPVTSLFNTPPTAIDDAITIIAGATVVIDVLGNDTDDSLEIDASTVEIQILTNPIHAASSEGDFVVQPNGQIFYRHNGNGVLLDEFTYTVSDSQGAVSNVATVSITVEPAPNFPPFATTDLATVEQGGSVSIDVLANDTDSDGDIDRDSVGLVIPPSKGTLLLDSDGDVLIQDGVFYYAQDQSLTFNDQGIATDSFDYIVADNDGATEQGRVVITIVRASNASPVAVNDSVTVTSGQSITINVLANDTDANGNETIDMSSIVIVSQPTHAAGLDDSFVIQPDGQISYQQNGNGVSSDEFTYTVKDSQGDVSNVATVFITIEPAPNLAPFATTDRITIDQHDSVSIDVLANDTDPGGSIDRDSVEVVSLPTGGTLLRDSGGSVLIQDGVFTYTQDQTVVFNDQRVATDTFDYRVSDDEGASRQGRVVITITQAPNQPPLAATDSATVMVGDSISISVLTNDTDADGDITIDVGSVTVSQPANANGIAVAQSDGSVSYTPNFDTAATEDSFTYTVADDQGELSNIATVIVTIIPFANTAPLTVDDLAHVAAGGSVFISVLTNDTDVDGDITINAGSVIVSQPANANGIAVAQSDGTVLYTPNLDTVATEDSFTYTVADDQGEPSNIAIVSVYINSPPVQISSFCPAYTESSLFRARTHTLVLSPNDADWEEQIAEAAPDTEILLEDGEYHMDLYAVYMANPNITVRSLSGNRDAVVIRGYGYTAGENEGFMTAADGITIADLTITDMVHHAISLKEEAGGDGVLSDNHVYNVHLYDIGTQHIKGAGAVSNRTRDAVIACSSIGYTPGGAVGDYNGGIDIYNGINVTLRDNYLYNITGDGSGCNVANPEGYCGYLSAPAIYMNGSEGTVVERNVVLDSFRGISLGLINGHTGGIVRNNFVYRSTPGDMGISIQNATDTIVEHNTVIVEGYFGPIESRGGSGHAFRNNLTNLPIQLRDNAENIILEGNIEFATLEDFVAPGNLHLQAGSLAIGSGVRPSAVTHDFDGDVRIGIWDVGADQISDAQVANAAPFAVNDLTTVTVGQSVVISVINNDTDADGNETIIANTVAISQPPTNGTAVKRDDGTVLYTPNTDTTATDDTFSYTVADDQNAVSNIATVTVAISPVPNTAPLAANDSATATAGQPIIISVLGNDTDIDGDDTINANSVTISQAPANGTAVKQNDGTVLYIPNTDTNATEDVFSYTVADDQNAVSNIATITVTIIPIPNTAPLAANDEATVTAGQSVFISVLSNDTDVDGNDTISADTVVISQAPTNGTAVKQDNGTVLYTPNTDTTATVDTFSYTVADNQNAISNIATVTVTISPVPNTAPLATNDSSTVTVGLTVVISVLTNDTDANGNETIIANTVAISQAPTNGTAVKQDDGTVFYTPDTDTTATEDTFSYTVTDDQNAVSNIATVTVTISPVPNTAPLAANDEATVTAGQTVVINVLSNDTDADGNETINANSVAITSDPNHAAQTEGSFVVQPNGSVFYRHNGNGISVDEFTYTVEDSQGVVSNIATVSITIDLAPNTPPFATTDQITITQGETTSIDVLANDTDSDGEIDRNSVELVSAPTKGTLLLDLDGNVQIQDGVFSYTQDQSLTFNNEGIATDTFDYQVADDDQDFRQGRVVITINQALNLVPIAVNDTATVTAGESVFISILTNDTDADGNETIIASTIAISQAPTNGTAVKQDDGTVLYTSNTNTTATEDTFSYTVADDQNAVSNIATVTVSITVEENVAPLATNDSVTITAGQAVVINILDNDSDANGDETIDIDSIVFMALPEHAAGTADSFAIQSDGQIFYRHNGNNIPLDEFTYTVKDSQGETSNVATVSIIVEPSENLPPFATSDQITIEQGETALIDVLLNDADPDGDIDRDSVTSVSLPTKGTLLLDADGSVLIQDGVFSYTQDQTVVFNVDGISTDTFDYNVADTEGGSRNGRVFITINQSENISPIAINDTATVAKNSAISINVIDNDSDANGDESIDADSVTIALQPTSGTAAPQSDGTILYTPDTDTTATEDSFNYTVSDNENALSNVATVIVTITPDENSVNSLAAFHRDGQTFITWNETSPLDGYHLYRHSAAITESNVSSATQITSKWGPLDSDTSVNTHGGPNVPDHFMIDELSAALTDSTGLFVYTTQPSDSSQAYYAVTSVVNGDELLSSMMALTTPVNESVSDPRDVLTVSVNQGKGRIYTQYMDYSKWNPTFNGYAYNYTVTLPADYNSAQSYPLAIEPHAFSEEYKFLPESPLTRKTIMIYPTDPGRQSGAIHSWWYGYAAEHNYQVDGMIPSSGPIANFTEQRVMRSIDEVIANNDFNVDENLIHAIGNSMGASGALSWGMRYGSLLSGIYANQPMTNYATDPVFQDSLVQLWGVQSDNLPIKNGGPHSEDISMYGVDGFVNVGVWDWMDHHKQLVDRRGDTFAFLMTTHGKSDLTIDWQSQGRPLVQAFTSANTGFTAVLRGSAGHGWLGFAVPSPLFGLGFDAERDWRYPLDLSYPAIQNASGSGPVVPANSGDDDYNMNIQWATPQTPFDTNIVDLPNRYEISLRSVLYSGVAATAQTVDITPRRTQQFRVNPNQQCTWTTVDNNRDHPDGSGTVTVDDDSLATVTGITITPDAGTRLVIDCS